ncbi:MAG TPA: hypothetical protein VNS46_02610 [Nocardioides sp.]|nr:hypothetical protein [Nocardioides sp.]
MHTSLRRVVLMVVALVASSLSLVAVSTSSAQAATSTFSQLGANYASVRYGTTVTFTGRVGYTNNGNPTYVPQGTVTLQRLPAGGSTWLTVSSRPIVPNADQTWTYKPAGTSTYRLLYSDGSGTYGSSASPSVKVGVRRNLNDNWRSATRTFYGKVAPKYAGKPVIIQKSTCRYPASSSCSWSAYRVINTNAYSNWSLKLPAYRTKTHFRAYVRPSSGYLGSLSNYYVTTYRY